MQKFGGASYLPPPPNCGRAGLLHIWYTDVSHIFYRPHGLESRSIQALLYSSSSDETVCNTHFESSDSEFEDPIVEKGIDQIGVST